MKGYVTMFALGVVGFSAERLPDLTAPDLMSASVPVPVVAVLLVITAVWMRHRGRKVQAYTHGLTIAANHDTSVPLTTVAARAARRYL